ncbi:hypothetical protein [Aestuariibaculum suncheonense]|uniref:Lipocalin-like domain-containing protein n=1 Tax=Aestuariibaculum suncheonense TaxID=1028745 RepID=A0A8J6Q9J0_9FLAO|nr:hypothetical protein [Aestuariibaculum suncheonense]MBD0835690.1 hypothetical protein [Aestuariibaculum suncheonense]
MKSIYTLTLLLVFILMPMSEVSAQTSETDLIGTWKLNYENTLSKVSQAMRSKFDSLPAQARTKAELAYRDRLIYLKSDESFLMSLTDGKTVSGFWKFNEGANQLEVSTSRGKVFNYKARVLNSNTLILVIDPLNTSALFSEMEFTKIKN